jgi:hypothetical protein
MLVPFANAGRNAKFTGWCLQQIRAYYPSTVPNLPPAAPGPATQGTIDCNAFGASITNGLLTGMAAAFMAAQHAAAPLQLAKTKEEWTDLMQEQIIKVMGKPANADFMAVAPSIWKEFVLEGKTADAVK